VGAAKLGDGVVAVAEEDRLVQPRGALALVGLDRVDAAPPAQGVGELVEEHPPQRPRIPRVAGEQRALDRLRQVDEAEHRLVQVREVGRQARPLGVGEGLDQGPGTVAPDPAPRSPTVPT